MERSDPETQAERQVSLGAVVLVAGLTVLFLLAGYAMMVFGPLFLLLAPLFLIYAFAEVAIPRLFGWIRQAMTGKAAEAPQPVILSRGLRQLNLVPWAGLVLGAALAFASGDVGWL